MEDNDLLLNSANSAGKRKRTNNTAVNASSSSSSSSSSLSAAATTAAISSRKRSNDHKTAATKASSSSSSSLSSSSSAAAAATPDEIIRVFDWEISQALKEQCVPGSNFTGRQKVIFTRDYSIDFPLDVLQNRVIKRFAPSIQQFTHVLDGLFSVKKVPEDVIPNILGYLFAWNEPKPVRLQCVTNGGLCHGTCLHPLDFMLPIKNPRDTRTFPRKNMFNSLQELDDLFEEYSFGLIGKVGKTLSISLPKEYCFGDFSSSSSISKFNAFVRFGAKHIEYLPSLSLARKFVTNLLFSFEFMRKFGKNDNYLSLPTPTIDMLEFLFKGLQDWWNTGRFSLDPNRIPGSFNPPRRMVNAVIDAENRVTPHVIARVLRLHTPIIDITEPHSLEIFVSVRTYLSARWAKDHVGIITVPHDASIVQLAAWIEEWIKRANCVGDDIRFGVWTYCNFKDLNIKMKNMLTSNLPAQISSSNANSHVGAAKATPPKTVNNFTVRIGKIQYSEFANFGSYSCYSDDDLDYNGDSDDDAAADDELKVPKVTENSYFKSVAVLGGRRAMIDLATRRCARGLDGADDLHFNFGSNSEVDEIAQVFFDCAICDVFPPPEEQWPSMNSMIKPNSYCRTETEIGSTTSTDTAGEFYLDCPFNRDCVEFDWDQVFADCYVVRRTPRLPDKEYPLEKRVRYPPHSYTYL